MDSDFLHPNQHQHQPQQQMNSGLTRYRSAPSSYFSSFLDGGGDLGGDLDQLLNPRALSPETEQVFRRFMCGPQDSASQNLDNAPHNPPANEFLQSQRQNQQQSQHQHFQVQMSGGYTSGSQMGYQSQQEGSNLGLDSSFRAENSDRLPPMKTGGGGGGSGGLIRHSSSPAGLFSNIDIEGGYGAMRGMGSYGAGNSTNAEESSHASRLKNQLDYSRRSASSSVHLSEIRAKILGNEEGFGENRRNDGSYLRGFQIGSWEGNAIDSFLSGVRETDKRKFSSLSESENQSAEGGNRPTAVLAHHLSLPKSSAELSAMEKLLQDSVPCQIRAKRGCATHPRSIAERVRRTKISERMRKLQELVPNMDKQTNTADMLDLAVDYIKDLQKQVQMLMDNCAKCTCSSKQKP